MNNQSENSKNLQKLIDIGIALSKEKNINNLLDQILLEARKITNSDGGTIYLMTKDNKLSFNIRSFRTTMYLKLRYYIVKMFTNSYQLIYNRILKRFQQQTFSKK